MFIYIITQKGWSMERCVTAKPAAIKKKYSKVNRDILCRIICGVVIMTIASMGDRLSMF